VLGAGMAGLAAAHRLRKAGVDVLVLEARGRVGGRVVTAEDTVTGVPVELGAEFVHGEPDVLLRYLKRAGLKVVKMAGKHQVLHDGKLSSAENALSDVQERMAEAGPDAGTMRAYLGRLVAEGKLSEQEADQARAFVEGYYLASVDQAGAYPIAVMERAGAETGAMSLGHVAEGYQRLAEFIGHKLHQKGRLRLNTVVKALRWKKGRVTASAVTRTGDALPDLQAKAAIITLPVSVLKQPKEAPGGLAFEPEVPGKREALAHLEFGPVVKFALRFRERFWDKRVGLLQSPGAAVPVWWAPRPKVAPLLVGWAGGPGAARLSGKPERALLDAAVDSLAPLLKTDRAHLAAQLEAWWIRDWTQDPYALGGYAVMPPEGVEAQKALAAPVDGTLFFAGEATHFEGDAGTVHGALETGERAADEYLAGRR